mgnify:CR=1 FL=1
MSKIAVYADWEGLRGPQYPPAPRDKFGVFDDSSPDRWGRNLMDRRFEREKRAGLLPADARLMSAAGKWW